MTRGPGGKLPYPSTHIGHMDIELGHCIELQGHQNEAIIYRNLVPKLSYSVDFTQQTSALVATRYPLHILAKYAECKVQPPTGTLPEVLHLVDK